MLDFSSVDRAILQELQMPDDAQTYFTPLSGPRRKIEDIIFRSPDAPVIGNDLVFEGTGPQFTFHRDDIPDAKQGTVFTRAGIDYVVTNTSRNEGFLWVAHCRLK